MNKRGKVYVMFLCGFMVLMLIAALFTIASYYEKYNQPGVGHIIGTKQGAVMTAIQSGERMNRYVQQASTLAVADAAGRASCGEDYLNEKVIDGGACETNAMAYQRALNSYLSSYPEGSLLGIVWQPLTGTLLQGKKTIPVGAPQSSTSTFLGEFTGWPTTDQRITGLFGNRNVVGIQASSNHPGLDIGSNHQVGQPVYDLVEGDAVYHPSGEYSYVEVKSPSIIIDYMHITADPSITNAATVHVTPGQHLGDTLAFYGGGTAVQPHVHLQVQLPDISATTIRNLGWVPDHAGPSDAHTGTTKSYAVLSGDKAYLNPICFFDRRTVITILQQSGLPTDQSVFEACDAYEAAFGLSQRFTAVSSSQTATAAQQSQQTSAQPQNSQPSQSAAAQQTEPGNVQVSATAPPEVTATQNRLAGMLQTITQDSTAEGADPALVLAIITAESTGRSDLISPTGCVGLGQFCYGTASGRQYDSRTSSWVKVSHQFDDIFGDHLTACGSNNACNSGNDARFDAEKNARATARLIKADLSAFQGYEQQIAFAIAGYNIGASPVLAAIDETGKGKQATWDEVKTQLLSLPISEMPQSIFSAGDSQAQKEATSLNKKNEAITYTVKVLQYYSAWGGHTFAGTGYSSDRIGEYDLRLVVDAAVPTDLNDVLSQMNTKLQTEDSQDAIDRMVMSFNANGIVVQREPLDATTGCMDEQERGQAYFANQIEACKRSPSSSCGCGLQSGLNAEYSISPSELQLTKLDRADVSNSEPMPGVSLNPGGDGDAATLDQYRLNNDALTVTADSATPKAELAMAQSRATITYTGPPSPAAQSAGITAITSGAYDVTSLYKGNNAIGFTSETVDSCVPYPAPKAYCLYKQSDPSTTLVFYVDMAAHSTVDSTPALTGYQVMQGNLKDINFTAHPYPYVHAKVTKPDRTVADYYLFVYNYGTRTRDEQVAASGQGRYWVLRQGPDYEVMLPRSGPDQLQLRLMDENLREGPALDVPDAEVSQPAQPTVPAPAASPSDATQTATQ